MEPWQHSLHDSLTDPRQLATRFGIDSAPLLAVTARYPLRITPYYLDLIESPGDPIWRQCVPDLHELALDGQSADPLDEVRLSPVPGLVHRYPDRALLLISQTCAVYCRFCTRKRQFGCNASASIDLPAALAYLARNPGIREVVLSGGDPLMLPDALLDDLLGRLRALPHLETIRIHSRVPVVLPERVTPRLCAMLRRYHPLFLNTHFNHPRELTPVAGEACARLADAGIPLGNQTVLLAGVNADSATLHELFRGLLRLRIRPYYLHQMDLVAGTGHFRTPIETGLALVAALRGPLTGMAIPHYVVDLPGGKGKVSLLPENIRQLGEQVILRAPDGELVVVPNRCRED